MPRFVILEHDHPELHWDFMLEAGDVLRTWRLADPPAPERAAIQALALADHRLAYLDYEGPVSGGRGHVKRWDRGNFEGDLTRSEMHIELHGERVRGRARLQPIAGAEWLLTLVLERQQE